jgi:hypothetical protein
MKVKKRLRLSVEDSQLLLLDPFLLSDLIEQIRQDLQRPSGCMLHAKFLRCAVTMHPA